MLGESLYYTEPLFSNWPVQPPTPVLNGDNKINLPYHDAD